MRGVMMKQTGMTIDIEQIKRLLAEATPAPWSRGDAVSSTKANLFSLHATKGAHIGTITGGSRSAVPAFDANLKVMCLAPDLATRVLSDADRIAALEAEIENLRTQVNVEAAKAQDEEAEVRAMEALHTEDMALCEQLQAENETLEAENARLSARAEAAEAERDDALTVIADLLGGTGMPWAEAVWKAHQFRDRAALRNEEGE
jgi:hypothetical protein